MTDRGLEPELTTSSLRQYIHAHSDPEIKLYGIADDDKTIMGRIKVITPFFLDMRDILKSALHAEVNVRKTCLIILQIHDMPQTQSAMDAISQQLPALAHLKLQTSCLRGLSHWPSKIHQRFFT